ncbi:MAG: GNAT family N-acetyltransferase [Actinomadura rubrobrunea]|nr:GNAT family N-acetyltransferase [Actinomadura rubrobrunea]
MSTDRHTDVRQAVEGDIAELVRLRALLFDTLGGDLPNRPSTGDDWRDALADVLKQKLADDDTRILVVDGDDGLAACGIGTVLQWFPSPQVHNGRVGHVIGMVTDPAYRRRGHARAIMNGLLEWFRQRDVTRVNLHASPDGAPLYRELGFIDRPHPSMYWHP